MQISVPVTDYIPASVLTTLNDIIVRGAAIPERLNGLLLPHTTHIGDFTRNAGGVQAYTGVGFTPSAIIILATDIFVGDCNWSIGYSNQVVHGCLYSHVDGGSVSISTAYCVYLRSGPGEDLMGVITSFDVDGFTITWTQTGTQALTGDYFAIP